MMEQLQKKDAIEEYKKNSKYCAVCGNPSLFDGCSINLVSISETGEVIAPFNNEFQGLSSIIPMCAYHMIIAQEGLIAITTKNLIIQSRFLTQLEPRTDAELNKFIQKLNRAEKNKINEMFKQTAKVILDARKFQKDIGKEIKEKNE
jgi:hypothetical protein